MQISELGEFRLIELLAQECGVELGGSRVPNRPGPIVDLGDDAFVSAHRDAALIWTTDTLVEGVHFSGGVSFRDLGWKALAVNLSDVAAMGGTPDWFLVTVSSPPEFQVDDLLEVYRGLNEAAQAYDVKLAGGDLVRSPVFSVTVALSGVAYTASLGQPSALRRAAARVGDLIAVSGSLGDSAAGLRLLQGGGENHSPAGTQLLSAHLRPRPRLDLGRRALAADVRCAIDISDGLVQDLCHIANASSVGLRVDSTRLPVSPQLLEAFPEEATTLALSGGEDYQLALMGTAAAIGSLISQGADLTEIGTVVSGEASRVEILDGAGHEIPITVGGWDHFRSS